MPIGLGRQDLQEAWPDTLRTEGYVVLTPQVQPPFITQRGDIVSGSHVGTVVLRGGGRTALGVWQEATGIYNVVFDQVMANCISICPVGEPTQLASGSQTPLSSTVGGYNSSNETPDVFGNLPTNYVAGTSGSITTAINALNDAGGPNYKVVNLGAWVTGSSPFLNGGTPATVYSFGLLKGASGSYALTDPVTNSVYIPFEFIFTPSDGTW